MIDTLVYLRLRSAYIALQAKRGNDECLAIIKARKQYELDGTQTSKQRLIDLVESYRAARYYPAAGGY